ncbi:hypothetical protein Tco_1292229 [Tanacetum coccineum]
MLESNAYKTYYAFASGEKTPKPKYVRKKANPDTLPKQKPVQATKGTKIKSKAKVAIPDKKKQPVKKPKAKGLAVLSDVELTKAEQLKLATKRSRTQFHSSYLSGSGDGVDTQSKVPNEQQQKTSSTDEGTGTIPGVPDVPIYESKSEKESWGDSDEEDDDEDDFDDDSDDNDESDDERMESNRDEIPDPNKTNEEHNEEEEEYNDEFNITEEEEKINNEETMNDDDDDEVTKELYDDVNVNLGNEVTEMTNADQADNTIASLMDTTAQHAIAILEITSSFTITVPPPPPFFNLLLPQATPTLTPTASDTTTSLFYAQDLSSIPAIVDRYMDNKLGEVINKAILAHNLDCRQEARDEKNAYIELVDTSMRALIKEEVNTQPSQILPQAILIDKMEKNKSYDKADYKKKLYDALVESYNTDKDLFDSYGEVFSLKRSRDEKDKDRDPSARLDRGTKKRKSSKDSSGKSAHAEEPSHTVEDSGMQQDQEFVTGDNDEQPANKEVTKAVWFKKPKQPPTPDPD